VAPRTAVVTIAGASAQPVGFGKRSGDHDRQVAPPVGVAADANEGLGGHLLDRVGGQQHGDGVVLGAGRVEHSASDAATIGLGLVPGRQGT